MQACEDLITSLVTPGQEVDFIVAGSCAPQISANPQLVTELVFNTVGTGAYQYLPEGCTAVIVQRQPQWGVIYYDSNPAAQNCNYNAYFAYGSGVDNPLYTNFTWPSSFESVTLAGGNTITMPLPIPVFVSTGSYYNPHGSHLQTVRTPDGFCWFPMTGFPTNTSSSAGSTYIAIVASSISSVITSVQLIYWDPATGERVQEGVISLQATTEYNLYPRHTGYYSLVAAIATNSTSPSLVFTATIVITGATTMCHRSISGWQRLGDVVASPRVMGASLLCTCTAPALNRNGDVIISQQSSTRAWPLVLETAATYADLFQTITQNTSYQAYQVNSWERGAYAFLKPEGGLSTLQNPTFSITSSLGGANRGAWLSSASPYTLNDYLIAIVTTQTSNASGIGRFTIDHWVNYESLSPWITGSMPNISTMQMIECLDKVALTPQFYENPSHIAALAGFVKSAARAILPEAIPLLSKAAGYSLQQLNKYAGVQPSQKTIRQFTRGYNYAEPDETTQVMRRMRQLQVAQPPKRVVAVPKRRARTRTSSRRAGANVQVSRRRRRSKKATTVTIVKRK